MKTYEDRMKTYEKPMKTYENLWQTYEKPMEKLLETHENLRKPTKTRRFEWFYCILRGAKRRGEKMSGLTVHYAARSAAEKI